MINSLPTRSPTVYKLSKKYKFSFKIRTSGKYYILVAEVFKSKKALSKSLKEIKRRFKGAYSNNYTPPVPKKKKEKEKVKKIVKVQKIAIPPVEEVVLKKEVILKKKIIVKKEKVIEKKVETKKELVHQKVQEKTLLEEPLEKYLKIFQEYFEWYYLVLLIIGSILFYYYRKFKKIYDEY